MDIMKKSFEGDLVYSAVEGGSRFEIVFQGYKKQDKGI